ncbi:hypothetical protein K2173_000621 [Erythroxylum novogranatense]|uniref:Rhodanese domain-containing protein n=1 Tax=Erythroxylum novogranatense TaxID=1862640 RepID=A0AAV8S7S3_9ROSI|nr:hypothetical protein K2173_000621 [Erythroxylum novogranatense]
MESLSMVLASALTIQNHPKALNFTPSKPSLLSSMSLLRNSVAAKTSLSFGALEFFTCLPCLASEAVSSHPQQVFERINLEPVLVSIDDFFNRNPFFVAGCTFIWLLVIPLTQEYLSKYKFISAIDAFRKLRDNPDAQLLDIRKAKTLISLGSPNLKIFNKSAVQVEFPEEGDDMLFVKNVLDSFQDPANTILCILDNFDGNSIKAAELLVKNGFKEAYAIRGGVRGKKGWLEIQENLLPPSVHVYPKKKKKKSKLRKLGDDGARTQLAEVKDGASAIALPAGESRVPDNGSVSEIMNSKSHLTSDYRCPYPNYPDLKPPSSPTPSKPRN